MLAAVSTSTDDASGALMNGVAMHLAAQSGKKFGEVVTIIGDMCNRAVSSGAVVSPDEFSLQIFQDIQTLKDEIES